MATLIFQHLIFDYTLDGKWYDCFYLLLATNQTYFYVFFDLLTLLQVFHMQSVYSDLEKEEYLRIARHGGTRLQRRQIQADLFEFCLVYLVSSRTVRTTETLSQKYHPPFPQQENGVSLQQGQNFYKGHLQKHVPAGSRDCLRSRKHF